MPNAAPDVFVMVYRRVGVLPSIEAMKRSFAVVYLAMTAAAALLADARAAAQPASALDGVWALNRSLSEFPREMGFDVDWIASPTGDGQSAGSSGGGRGRRGSGGGARGSAGALSLCPPGREGAPRPPPGARPTGHTPPPPGRGATPRVPAPSHT